MSLPNQATGKPVSLEPDPTDPSATIARPVVGKKSQRTYRTTKDRTKGTDIVYPSPKTYQTTTAAAATTITIIIIIIIVVIIIIIISAPNSG